MRGISLKLLSVACALIMVMTVFQVLTADVSADPVSDSAKSDPYTHDHLRLTISNKG